MTKADWLILAGYVLLVAGAAYIYRPLGILLGGLIVLQLGRTAARQTAKSSARERRR